VGLLVALAAVRGQAVFTARTVFAAPDVSSTTSPGSAKDAPSTVPVEVVPVIELIGGLVRLIPPEEQGPSGHRGTVGVTDYQRALVEWLSPHKDHPAVDACVSLMTRGMGEDLLVWFACHLGPLPDLTPAGNLEPDLASFLDLLGIAATDLEDFRQQLAEFAAEVDFAQFIAQWEPKFVLWVDQFRNDCDIDACAQWVRGLVSDREVVPRLVLAPSMTPGGGYGPWYEDEQARKVLVAVIRESGLGQQEPVFVIRRQGLMRVEEVLIHEWCHPLVNSVTRLDLDQIQRLGRFYKGDVPPPYTKELLVTMWVREQVLRGISAAAAGSLYGQAAGQESVRISTNQGFPFTGLTSTRVAQYLSGKTGQADFAKFTSGLVKTYAFQAIVPAILIGAFLLVAVGGGTWYLVHLRRRKAQAVAASPTEPPAAPPPS
jgi:hypothetical protein